MALHEEANLTMVKNTKALSVFLSCGSCLSYIYDFGLDKKDERSRYKRFQELESPFATARENLTKAEAYFDTLQEYIEHPEKFCDIDATTGQKTYKDTERLKDGFKDFVRDINVALDTFIKNFIPKIAFDDPEKLYLLFTENKPGSHKTSLELEERKKKFIEFFSDSINPEAFDSFFDLATKTYFDINEKRNFFEHTGKTHGEVIFGNYGIKKEGEEGLSVNYFPKVEFMGEHIFLHEYADMIFFEALNIIQNILALYVHRICEQKQGTSGMGVPRFYPIGFLLKECGSLPSHNFYDPSSGQKFMFGYFGEPFAGRFMPYSGSRPHDPDYLDKLKGLHQ